MNSITMPVRLKPFTVPSYVLMQIEQGDVKHVSLPLSEIPKETLSAMCDQFKKDVMDRASVIAPSMNADVGKKR